MASTVGGILDSLLTSIGYPAVFALVGSESLGIPVPGETMLITAGVYAGASHNLSIAGVIGAAIAGAIVGDNIGYVVGHKGGLRLLRRYGRFIRLTERRLKLARYLFFKYGGSVVFFGRFVSILRTYAAFFAGTTQMPWRRFFLFNASGGIVWSVAFGLAAYYGQQSFQSASTPLAVALVGAAVVLVALLVRFVRRHAEELAAEAERTFPSEA
jgi:membrane protein DedA with SNARE-associated domain